MQTIRCTISTIAPVAIVWVVLIAFAFWQDADWPDERRYIWLTVAVVATFLMIVSTMMLRRMHGVDWLTISLAAAFAAVSLMPFYLLASSMWRAFFAEHQRVLLYAVCIGMAVPALWAIVMLAITPDGDGP